MKMISLGKSAASETEIISFKTLVQKREEGGEGRGNDNLLIPANRLDVMTSLYLCVYIDFLWMIW